MGVGLGELLFLIGSGPAGANSKWELSKGCGPGGQ